MDARLNLIWGTVKGKTMLQQCIDHVGQQPALVFDVDDEDGTDATPQRDQHPVPGGD